MILLPSAFGTVNSPPLIFVPGRAVVMDGVWQTAQPVWLNSASPAEDVSGYRSSRRGFRRAHEVSEGHDIDTVVLGVGDWIIRGAVSNIAAIGRVLIRKKRSCDTHFVKKRVSGKRYKTRMLTFPPETPNARLTTGFEHRDHDGRTAHRLRLFIADG